MTKPSDKKAAERPTITQDADAPQPIGVPQGFMAPGPDFAYLSRGGIGPTTPDRIAKPAQFFEGSDWEPASRPPDRIADLQQAMADAGVLSTKYRKGVWDDASRSAYRDVLALANATGGTPEDAIQQWAASTEAGDDEGRTFDPLPFRPPDQATLRQNVKKAFKDILPRELRDSELDYLAGQAQALLAQEHQAEEGARRAQYDAEGTGAPGAAVPVVDADARFRELLETRYKPQIRLVGEQAENVETKEFVGKSLLGMSRMIGGTSG